MADAHRSRHREARTRAGHDQVDPNSRHGHHKTRASHRDRDTGDQKPPQVEAESFGHVTDEETACESQRGRNSRRVPNHFVPLRSIPPQTVPSAFSSTQSGRESTAYSQYNTQSEFLQSSDYPSRSTSRPRSRTRLGRSQSRFSIKVPGFSYTRSKIHPAYADGQDIDSSLANPDVYADVSTVDGSVFSRISSRMFSTNGSRRIPGCDSYLKERFRDLQFVCPAGHRMIPWNAWYCRFLEERYRSTPNEWFKDERKRLREYIIRLEKDYLELYSKVYSRKR